MCNNVRVMANDKSPKTSAPVDRPPIARHVIALVITAALIVMAYSNAPRGAFVYDDTKQILKNELIQYPQFYWTALKSDVWAFKGIIDEGRSNYWRPAFVALNIACFAAFGKDPAGWHVVNIVLHGVVSLLVYCVLLRLGNAEMPRAGRHADATAVGMAPGAQARADARAVGVAPGGESQAIIPGAVAAAVTWLFAAHPVHVESVTWVAGSPDLLLAIGLLGAYLCFLNARARPTIWNVGGMIVLYAFAQLSKEGAIVFPAIVVLTGLLLPLRGVGTVQSGLQAFVLAVPLVVIAGLFVVTRFWILKFNRIDLPWAPTLAGVLMTMPSLLAFYLRQAVFPWMLGPQYPLRAVVPGAMTGANFFVPLVVCIAVLAIFVWLSRTRRGYRVGLIWFAMPILLSLDIRSFRPEELVHDRYLYLPLMGVLLLVCLLVHDAIAGLIKRPRAAGGVVAGIALVASAGLAIATHQYNVVWSSEAALWTRATQVDPTSASAFGQLAQVQYVEDKKTKVFTKSKASYLKALEIHPQMTQAHLGLGFIANAEGRPADAQRYFETVLLSFPQDEDARDNLALSLQMQGRYDEGIRVLDEGRRQTPYRYARYTVNIAVLHVLAKRMGTAIGELEAIRDTLNESVDPAVLLGWRHLAMLYQQTDQPAKALEACDAYLKKTERFADDPEVAKERKGIAALRSRLAAGG